MALVEYTYYKNSYLKGIMEPVITESKFPYYEARAEVELKNSCKLDASDTDFDCDEVRNALCDISESLFKFYDSSVTTNTPKNVSSEKVGEYSVSYSNNSEEQLYDTMEKNIARSIKKWLGMTGLLFRGI